MTNTSPDLTNLKTGSIFILNTDDSDRQWRAIIVHHMSRGIYVNAESLADYDVDNEYHHGTPLPRKLIPATQIASYSN